MLILPAIDLRGGQCVRLRQGDFEQETVFGSDPVAIARRWVDQGATYLHLVDLDGARDGHPVNETSIRQIVEKAAVPCQLGGGLRKEADLEQAFGWGVERVVVGTRAAQEPRWLEEMCHRFPGRIVLGIDAKDGHIATDGWLNVLQCSAIDLVGKCAAWPLAAVAYTDIRRDGMLSGPNFEALTELAASTRFPVIASGGIHTLDDVKKLASLRVAGCIVGRALYEGQLALPKVIETAEHETRRQGTWPSIA